MKGVSNVIAISALLIIAMGLVAILLPWAWNSMTQVVDVMGRASEARSKEILAMLVFYPPPAIPSDNNDQVLLVLNVGEIPLTNVKVIMVRKDLTQADLNFYIITTEGVETNWGYSAERFLPGDVIVARVPYEQNYIGYQFVIQSPDYSEAFVVGG